MADVLVSGAASGRGLRLATGLALVCGTALVTFGLSSGAGVPVLLGLLALAFLVGAIGVSRRDAASLLGLMIGLLFLVPENYVLVGPLKSVGNPAQLLGMVCLVVWVASRLLGLIRPVPSHPVRWVLLAYVIATLTSFGAASMRILSEDEAAGSVRSLFPAMAMLGIALLAVDGLVTKERLDAVLFLLVAIAGVAAGIGLLEYAIGNFRYADFAHLPGLTTNTEVINDTRSGFHRIDGAAAHPIEYAVALAALAPLSLHHALHAATAFRRRVGTISLVAILVVNPMTVSRSGLLALAVGLGIYAVQLSLRAKLNALVLSIIGLVLFRTAIPGLLGTLKSLVLIGDEDPSIAGRTQDYEKIPGLMEGHWVFGRGLGTFQPLTYFYLDNQYLGSLLEGGLLAAAVFMSIFVVGVGVARGYRKRVTAPADRGLGQALAASIAALGASAVTFDELSFHQTGFMVFFLLGCAGAAWSMARAARAPSDLAGTRSGSSRDPSDGEGGAPRAHELRPGDEQRIRR